MLMKNALVESLVYVCQINMSYYTADWSTLGFHLLLFVWL